MSDSHGLPRHPFPGVLPLLGILLCLGLTGCNQGSSGNAQTPPAATAPTATSAASGTASGNTATAADARWDLATGAHAPDDIDTTGWLPLSIALDSMTLSSTSPRLNIQTDADTTTVTLDGNPIATLTRGAQSVALHITPTGNNHLRLQLTGTGTTPLTIQGEDDYGLVLTDAHLASPNGPALDLQSTGTAFIQLQGASTLSDAAAWNARTDAAGKETDPKATLSAQGSLVFRGEGSLKIDSAAHHALYTEGHLRQAGGSLSLSAAAKDGMRATRAFIMDAGTLDINTPAGKGIKVSGEESTTQPLGFVAINDGRITIRSHDKAITAGWKRQEDARTPGTEDDPDPRLTINGGTLNITTTGTPVEDTSDDEGDGGLSPEGIEAKSVITVRGGNLTLNTTDDCFNAGTHFEQSGGRIYAYSHLQDAVDSNGTMTISGGQLVAVSHAPRPEGALDSDSHEFAIKGGTFIGIGAYNSTPTASASTQNAIAIPTYVEAGEWTLRDAAGNVAFSYRLPFRAGYLIASAPSLARGATYTVVRNGTLGPVGEDFHGLAIRPTTVSGGTPGDTFSITSTVTHLGATEFDWYSPELGPGD